MYDKPVYTTHTLKAATISSAATLLTVMGPAGLKGRLVGISATATTSTTTAATELRVGTASDADAFGIMSFPVATAGAASATNTITNYCTDDNVMAADTAVVIATDGGCDAGAADIAVTIAWY